MKLIISATIAAAALLATGCANDAPTQAPPVTVFVTPTTVPASAASGGRNIPQSEKSPRGNLIKTVGTPSAIGGGTDPDLMYWTVTNITVDEPCSRHYADKASRGHFVALDIEAETTAAYDGRGISGFHPGNDWSLVDGSGVTLPSAASVAGYTCHEPNWPVEMQPSSKYKFRLTFDSPTTSGILVFTPSGAGPTKYGGWEWAF
ncbi:hypothetical protein [Nocardia salmonicida]|uniref:hypothetical protein n=1 Tax=Nocardia salmonicida TaxID=53431 RepID=UPI003CEC2EA6